MWASQRRGHVDSPARSMARAAASAPHASPLDDLSSHSVDCMYVHIRGLRPDACAKALTARLACQTDFGPANATETQTRAPAKLVAPAIATSLNLTLSLSRPQFPPLRTRAPSPERISRAKNARDEAVRPRRILWTQGAPHVQIRDAVSGPLTQTQELAGGGLLRSRRG